MPDDLHTLRRIALFHDLNAADLTRVAAIAVRHTYAPGEVIQIAGDPNPAVSFIAAGHVSISRLAPTGREQILTEMGPGQAFNTVPPFQPEAVNHANVQALDAVTLYLIPGPEFRNLARELPPLALALLQDFAHRLADLTELVDRLALHSVRGRLARFLLEQAEADQITRRWTQDAIAAHLGTVRDVVGRTLRAFVDAGLIRMERQQIILLDRAALEEEARD
jgi:CRP-like cAMP-binding protein